MRFVVLIMTALLCGCERGPTTDAEPTIPVAEETLWQAEDQGFDYRGWLAQAETGDVHAIRKLLNFEGDAGGAYLHCFVLGALLEKAGDEPFAKACRGISDREHRRGCVNEFFVMGRKSIGADWPERYPLTAAALGP